MESGFFVSGTLDSGFQSLVRFQIPQGFWLPQAKFPDSKFTNNFSDFGIQVALHKAKTELSQRAKKVVSDSPGLVDFAIGLVNSVLNLSDGQAKIFRRIKI